MAEFFRPIIKDRRVQAVAAGLTVVGLVVVLWIDSHRQVPVAIEITPKGTATSAPQVTIPPTTEVFVSPTAQQILTGQVYANDGTPFNVVPDPLGTGRACAEISAPFANIPEQKQNTGRLAQALGGGRITFYRDGFGPITHDTTADPWPEDLSLVHVGDFACVEP